MNVLDQLIFLGQLHGLDAAVAEKRARVWCEKMKITDAIAARRPKTSPRACSRRSSSSPRCCTSPTSSSWTSPSAASIPSTPSCCMDTLLELRQQGKAILFSTHRMDQVEKLCDHIALIHGGKLVLSGSMREIKSSYPRNRIQISFEGDDSLPPPSRHRVSYKRYSGQAEIVLKPSATLADDAQPLLAPPSAAPASPDSRSSEPTLEDIFIEKVQQTTPSLESNSPRSRSPAPPRGRRCITSGSSHAASTSNASAPAASSSPPSSFPLHHGRLHRRQRLLRHPLPARRHIAVVSSDTQLALDLQTELERSASRSRRKLPRCAAKSATSRKPVTIFVDAIDPSRATRNRLDDQLDSGDLDGYLWITPAATPGARPRFDFVPRSVSEAALRPTLAGALERVLLREQLAHRGIIAADANTMLQPVVVRASHNARHTDRESARSPSPSSSSSCIWSSCCTA